MLAEGGGDRLHSFVEEEVGIPAPVVQIIPSVLFSSETLSLEVGDIELCHLTVIELVPFLAVFDIGVVVPALCGS